MSDEQQQLLAQIDASRDWIDILTALLSVCRAHAHELSTLAQGRETRKLLAAAHAQVRENLSTTAVSRRTRQEISEQLGNVDYPYRARVIAVAIDLEIRGSNPQYYSVMCAALGERKLDDRAPYPTPSFPLAATFGPGGFSMQPKDGGSVLEVDRVPGLALWNTSAHGALTVVYDPIAGSALDDALDSSVDILTVSPNQSYSAEFSVETSTANGFFGVKVIDHAKQDSILRESLEYCESNSIDILALPELAATEESDLIVRRAFEAPDRRDCRHPSIVIAGSRHARIKDKQVNRLTIAYRPHSHLVYHDKVGRFVVGGSECYTARGLVPNSAGDEDIDRGNSIRIHAGIEWSMIPLICADFLDQQVIHAAAALHPRLVIVSAMSQKTSDFEDSAGTVISACQSTVVVVNGPVDWRPDDSREPLADAESSTVAVFGLPLNDPTKKVIRLKTAIDASAPHRVHFSSLTRSAVLLS
ncbi:hypothetical protein RE9416_16980 [Prescottella equi]|nr:hypothetical protein RE9416_16980 [Prescottella equi]